MNYDKRTVELPLIDQYKKTESLSQSHIYKLRPQELALLFERDHLKKPENDGEKRESLIILEKMNYTEGLLDKISTNSETGIIGDEKDIMRRQQFFGKNDHRLPLIQTFLQAWIDKLKDQNIIILFCAATFQLGIALMNYQTSTDSDYFTPISIYFAIFFATVIEASCDHAKEKQILKILELKQQESCTVFRGQYGTTVRLPYNELVVGDIIQIEQGMIVPADCMMIYEMDVWADQKIYLKKDTAEDVNTVREKKISQQWIDDNNQMQSNHLDNPDPFLLYGSEILSGYGRAVVLAVGDNTLHAQEQKGQLLEFKVQETDLQKRLHNLASLIGNGAKAVALTVFVLRLVWYLILAVFTNGDQIISSTSLIEYTQIFMTAVTILVVSIPEGLPLAISLAMSFSIRILRKENLIIKKLESIENMGRIHHLCVGKQNTLTTGNLKVEKWVFNQSTHENHNSNFQKMNINEDAKELIKESIVLNNTARIEMTEDDARYVVEGQNFEKCMLNFLFDNDYDVQHELIEKETNFQLLTLIPFSPETKTMITAHKKIVRGQDPFVRVVVKGAPEYVLQNCSFRVDESNHQNQFNGQQESYEQRHINPQQSQGFTTITYAYKDMDYMEFEQLNQQFNGFERGQDRYRLINNLNYLTTFFIRDDVRDGIKEQVSQLSFDSDIQIRMCTGDSVQTATCIALQANIITEHELKNQQYCVITGDQLMELTGEVNVGKTFTNRQTNTISAKNKEIIKNIHKQIKVVARCTPEHKFALVSALQSIMGRVACTGESIGDVKALKWANVGLCMGSGCNVAKMAADIIIEEDQFKTIYRANQWGRNVSQSVRKFLQFQLTVNISACTFLVLSALIIGQTPFAIIQLLWINVVMDIFAALSLATEPPPKHQEQLSQDVKRIQKKDKIITVTMWKYIFGQVAYQQFIMLIFLFFGPMMFGESYNLWSGEDKEGSTESQTKHYTFLFALFMQMNLFNQMNARKVNDEELNIFSNVHNNLMYILILIVEFFVVYVMVHFNPQVFSAAQIGNTQHWIAFIFGVLSLAVGAGLKKVANKDIAKYFEKIPEDMDDEKLRQIKTVVDSVDKQFERSETQRGFDSAR